MNITDLLREMIETELEEAGVGAIGSASTLQMVHGVLQQILAKYGGDYTKASQSQEWKTAIANAEQARQSSTQTNLVKPFQTLPNAPTPAKPTIGGVRASLAQKQQQQAQQQQRSVEIAARLRQQQKQKAQMETKLVDSTGLVETIRALVKEALKGIK